MQIAQRLHLDARIGEQARQVELVHNGSRPQHPDAQAV